MRTYGTIVQPITTLFNANTFVWNDKARTTWDLLKHAMVVAHVLALPNFDATFIVESDASRTGLRVCLARMKDQLPFSTKPYHLNSKSSQFMRRRC